MHDDGFSPPEKLSKWKRTRASNVSSNNWRRSSVGRDQDDRVAVELYVRTRFVRRMQYRGELQ